MDVAWFLEQRTKFIHQLYHVSVAPFVERIRLIEAEEPPFEPPYCENSEPAFLEEWQEAYNSIQILGHTCVSMLAGALHLYLETWEKNVLIKFEPSEKKKMFKNRGWFLGYQTVFAEKLGVRFDNSGANLAMLEQLVLARNRIQHPETLLRITPTHAQCDRVKHPNPFFLSDYERELLIEIEAKGHNVDDMWMQGNTLYVDTQKLETVFSEVNKFSTWLDRECFERLYPRKDET